MLHQAVDRYRSRVVDNATGLFKHAEYPLARTLSYRGDPGLFGPGSITWEVVGDPSAFLGGIRALLVQACHPEVVAGVADHSRYREDPLGRLSRTSNYVTATSYGAMPEVETAVRVVRGVHRRVRGASHRGVAYAAEMPDLAAWVHNALTDSFLVAFRHFGRRRPTTAEEDRFVAEQTRVGALLDADPMPATAAELGAWLAGHPGAGRSPGMEEAVAFLRSPPLPFTTRIGYRLLFVAAVATLPRRLRQILGLRRVPGAMSIGRVIVGFLRWALGFSPSWHLALVRAGAPVPEGLFRQPLPPEAAGSGS
jgi:uncharacterized protein (DUF2236 family)